jgi:hypothetical protein
MNIDNQKQYLCLFSLITAGLLDEDMGSDEQEITEMINLILDVDEKKVSRSIFNELLFTRASPFLDGGFASTIRTTNIHGNSNG